jgi:hypothetical protein
MSNSQTVSDPINTTFQITFLIQVLFDNSQNDNQTTKQPNNLLTNLPPYQITTYHLTNLPPSTVLSYHPPKKEYEFVKYNVRLP